MIFNQRRFVRYLLINSAIAAIYTAVFDFYILDDLQVESFIAGWGLYAAIDIFYPLKTNNKANRISKNV